MRPMVLLAAGLALCACADTSIVHHSYYNSAYTPDHVQLASASGTALAVIRNDPSPRIATTPASSPRCRGGISARACISARQRDRMTCMATRSSWISARDMGRTINAKPAPRRRQPPGQADRSWFQRTFCVGDRLLTDAVGSNRRRDRSR